MGEFIMKKLVRDADMEHLFEIASAATSTEEIGNPVYPQARRKLAEHGIRCDGKTARKIRAEDYEHYDLIVGMDSANRRNLLRFYGQDPEGKISLLLDHTDHPRDVSDPWYSDDFDTAWKDILEGCEALLKEIKGSGKL